MDAMNLAKATIGGGCFWCLDAAFRRVEGVKDVVSGYAGGDVADPSYEMVINGSTGHAEVVDIEFDEEVISYDGILDVFFTIHDPTTKDRQGNDVGSQYRSIILHHDSTQEETARSKISRLNSSGTFKRPIVTELKRLVAFYPAEDYHQDYYRLNPRSTYCRLVIAPKLERMSLKSEATDR